MARLASFVAIRTGTDHVTRKISLLHPASFPVPSLEVSSLDDIHLFVLFEVH
jgi:hypothetical protein